MILKPGHITVPIYARVCGDETEIGVVEIPVAAHCEKMKFAKTFAADKNEGTVLIDGENFPYYISPDISVTSDSSGFSEVTITLFVDGDVEITSEG